MRRKGWLLGVAVCVCVLFILSHSLERSPLSPVTQVPISPLPHPLTAWADEPAKIKKEEGDNSRCLCCHIDFDGEDIVEKHLAQKITCRSCHGPSEQHRQDETLRTKPDLLWGRAQVKDFCAQCHKEHKKPAAVEEFRQKWLDKARPNGRFIRKDAVCTDCHGEHTVPPKR